MENQPLLPQGEDSKPQMFTSVVSASPSGKRQSLGVVISTVIIVLMIVIGAFYAWGKRIAEENAFTAPSSL